MANFARQLDYTDASSVARSSLASSVPGMAHFASTGPTGTVCKTCRHWKVWGRKQKPFCHKFFDMTGNGSLPVPADTPACKYYEAAQ